MILVLLVLPLLLPALRAVVKAGPRYILAAVAIGAGASALATILFTEALFHGDFITPVVIQKVQPLVAVAAAALILSERPRPRFAWFLLPALVGFWLVNQPHPLDPQAKGLIPIIQALAAAVLWALGTVLGRYLGRKLEFQQILSLRFLFGLAGSAVALAVMHSRDHSKAFAGWHDTLWIAYLAVVTGLFALALYYIGLKRTPAVLASLAELTYPAIAVIAGIYAYNSHLRWTQWIGVATIIGRRQPPAGAAPPHDGQGAGASARAARARVYLEPGFSASSSASPTRLTQTRITTSTTPGKNHAHQPNCAAAMSLFDASPNLNFTVSATRLPSDGGNRLGHAEAEELDGRVDEHDEADQRRRRDEDRAADVRQEMPREDPRVRRAERARGLDVLRLAQPNDVGAHHTRDGRPHERREDDDQRVRIHGPEVDEGGEREDDCRVRRHEIRDPHDDRVEPAAEVAGEQACDDADERSRSRLRRARPSPTCARRRPSAGGRRGRRCRCRRDARATGRSARAGGRSRRRSSRRSRARARRPRRPRAGRRAHRPRPGAARSAAARRGAGSAAARAPRPTATALTPASRAGRATAPRARRAATTPRP